MIKTVDAFMVVRDIRDGAIAYYNTPHFSRTDPSQKLPRQLPSAFPEGLRGNTPCTASSGLASAPSGREQRPLNLRQPGMETCWEAVGLEVSRPNYYGFLYRPDNRWPGKERFVVWAYGDLDGDGDYGTLVAGGAAVDGVATSDRRNLWTDRYE